MNYLEQFFAKQIDFKYDKKSDSYLIQRLNADLSYVLYKDGRYRPTTEKEIKQQLAK